jgi:hypothetical protein
LVINNKWSWYSAKGWSIASRTKILSDIRERIDMTDIGLISDGMTGEGILGIGWMIADFTGMEQLS